jgi:hypothetical protein
VVSFLRLAVEDVVHRVRLPVLPALGWWRVKLWFNRAFPYYRLCLHRWCLRGMTYDHRCWKHQGDL